MHSESSHLLEMQVDYFLCGQDKKEEKDIERKFSL